MSLGSTNESAPQYPTGYVPTAHSHGNISGSQQDTEHALVFGIRALPQIQPAQSAYTMPTLPTKKHNHYYKDVSKLEYIDVYRVLGLFSVTDPCLQHAVKKLLVAGGRGAGKDIDKDVQEAIDSLVRYQEMQKENGK